MLKVKVEIQQGNILATDCDVIVNPANSLGLMGGGVALAIKRAGGEVIETEAMAKAPIEVGSAIATSAGSLKLKAVIHTPTMWQPAEPASKLNVAQATRAALSLADSLNFKSVAFPGMGTGVGRLPVEVAAEAMLNEILGYSPVSLNSVILVDLNLSLVEAWNFAFREFSRLKPLQ